MRFGSVWREFESPIPDQMITGRCGLSSIPNSLIAKRSYGSEQVRLGKLRNVVVIMICRSGGKYRRASISAGSLWEHIPSSIPYTRVAQNTEAASIKGVTV